MDCEGIEASGVFSRIKEHVLSSLVKLSDVTVDNYVRSLNKKMPFGLSRWGDGEWRSVLSENDLAWKRLTGLNTAWRKGKTNKSGHSFPPEMGVDMRKLLLSRQSDAAPNTQRLALADRFTQEGAHKSFLGMGHWIHEWLARHGLGAVEWDATDLIVKAFYKYKFEPFLEALQQSPIVVVGPTHLKKLRLFPVAYYVGVPSRDAYKIKDRVVQRVSAYLEKADEHTVVSISVGPSAAILVEEIRRACKNQHTVIDLGSIWDPFVGQFSRRYMERPELQEYAKKLLRV
jgi:hypothetical protein